MKIKLAGLTVEIKNRYDFVERLCRGYESFEEPLFSVAATDEEIAREREVSEGDFPDSYLESIVAYRKIAEELPRYDAFVFHGAVLSIDGGGYLFTARSGVGKTTHTRLIIKRVGERAYYVNGDKPIIRFIDGIPYAYGTPWNGKERYGANTSVPLRGVAVVHRGETNYTTPAEADAVTTMLVSQSYIPKRNARLALAALGLCNRLIEGVKLIDLYCNMDDSAADASLSAFGITI